MAERRLIERAVLLDSGILTYQLERKPVKNMNLRISRDGSVYVSANQNISVAVIDAFVISKEVFIRRAIEHFHKRKTLEIPPKEMTDGAAFYLLGRLHRLRFLLSENGEKETVWQNGEVFFVKVKDLENSVHKQRLLEKYFHERCMILLREIFSELYPAIEVYGVLRPHFRLRTMRSCWGACMPKKGIITLNRRLFGAPRSCIEYVIMHELCHLLYPNHSKQFYAFLEKMMPDFRIRKKILTDGFC